MTKDAVRPSFGEACWVWARVALLSFGGPAGQIAVMHRILVDEKRWISEARFLHALNYCMLLPGPEAQQLATYIGWLLHGTRGGLLAGILFVLPGALAMLGLSLLYASYQSTAWLTAVFFGLKAAVLAILIGAVRRIATRVLHNQGLALLSALAFAALFLFAVPFPWVILAAAVTGAVGGRLWPGVFVASGGHGATGAADDAVADAAGPPSLRRTGQVLLLGLSVWAAPALACALWLGSDHVLVRQAVFFAKAAVVTFGGAYAVLAYVAQQAVEVYGWLRPGEMIDGLGLAETTPGPLILVVQFVGFLGAYRMAEPFTPLAAGMLGAGMTLWVTFVPSLLWIFLGAPYVESLRGNRLWSTALAAITAAVVGVVANLALWFGLHVLFAQTQAVELGPLQVLLPDPSSLQPMAGLVAVLGCELHLRRGWGVAGTLAVCTLLGAALVYAGA